MAGTRCDFESERGIMLPLMIFYVPSVQTNGRLREGPCLWKVRSGERDKSMPKMAACRYVASVISLRCCRPLISVSLGMRRGITTARQDKRGSDQSQLDKRCQRSALIPWQQKSGLLQLWFWIPLHHITLDLVPELCSGLKLKPQTFPTLNSISIIRQRGGCLERRGSPAPAEVSDTGWFNTGCLTSLWPAAASRAASLPSHLGEDCWPSHRPGFLADGLHIGSWDWNSFKYITKYTVSV